MKLWFLGLVLAVPGVAQQPAGPKPSITFDGKQFALKFVDQNNALQLNEYYLRDETPEKWTYMLSATVYLNTGTGTPADMARNMERILLNQHSDAPHELVTRAKDDVLLSCMNWSGDRQTTSEYWVYRFRKHPRGILGYQASLRPYQAKMPAAAFTALRERWKSAIQTANFPDVFLKMP